MNYRMIIRLLGWVTAIVSALMAIPAAVGVFYGEDEWKTYALVMLAGAAFGLILTRIKVRRTVLYAKDGFVTVALSWIILSLIGALPLWLTGETPSFVDALFEISSGFTTTGATILTNVEALSHASLMWRSFSIWIGGMGVLVFLLALVPLAGGGSVMQLMKAESPGPSVSKLVPRVRETAVILYSIYSVLTVLEIILLIAGKMPWFDAVNTALSTAGTGGFAVKNAGIGFYDSYYLQGVISVFMILFSINFSVYYLLLLKRIGQALRFEEMRWYLALIAIAVTIITLDTYKTHFDSRLFPAFHHALFSVASVMSTTGFATVDFNLWPQVSRTTIFFLIFIGACAGSTGGGLKVSRLAMLLKGAVLELYSIVHPHSVKTVKLDKKRVDNETLRSVSSFFVLYIAIYVISAVIVSADGFDMTTNLSAVATALNNVGPGLNKVGPAGNFSEFSPLSKLVFIFDMIAGRLEIFPMLVLISPTTWKGTIGVIKRRILCRKKAMQPKRK